MSRRGRHCWAGVTARGGLGEDIVYAYRCSPGLRRRAQLKIRTVSSARSTLASMCAGLNPRVRPQPQSRMCTLAASATQTFTSVLDRDTRAQDLANIVCPRRVVLARQAQGVGHNCQAWMDAARAPLTRFRWKRELARHDCAGGFSVPADWVLTLARVADGQRFRRTRACRRHNDFPQFRRNGRRSRPCSPGWRLGFWRSRRR